MHEYRKFLIEQLDIRSWAVSIISFEQSHITPEQAYVSQMKLWLPHGNWEMYHARYMQAHKPTKTERIEHLLSLGKPYTYIQSVLNVSPN